MGMAYIGTTSASSVANPPRAVQPVDSARLSSTTFPVAARLWLYGSTGGSTDPFTAGFFSDAKAIGMQQGDIVIYVQQGSTVSSSQVLGMGVLGALSTAGAAALSTHSFMTST